MLRVGKVSYRFILLQTRIAGTVNPNEHLNLILTAISDNVPNVSLNLISCFAMFLHINNLQCVLLHQAKGPIIMKEDTTRHLLSCVLWVLKNTERPLLRLWWSELSTPRLQTMLEILRICVSCFQYKVGQRIFRILTSLLSKC